MHLSRPPTGDCRSVNQQPSRYRAGENGPPHCMTKKKVGTGIVARGSEDNWLVLGPGRDPGLNLAEEITNMVGGCRVVHLNHFFRVS